MRLLDGFRWMGRAVLGSRQRSGLTMLGIAIGIAAVASLTSIGEGLRVYLMDSFSQFGTRIIAITPGKVTTQGMAGMLKTVKPLSVSDAESLRELPFVEQVVPLVSGTAKVEAGRWGRNTNVVGAGHEAAEAWKIKVVQGRFLPPDDPLNARAYAVLGAKLKEELFAGRNPLGALIRVGGARFRVIGVMENKGQLLGFDLDDMVYIPLGRAQQLFDMEGVMEIDVVFSELASSVQMATRVKKRLKALHGREDFTLFTQEDMLTSLDKILGVITLAIAGLGGISLFVGGVGVLTIMTTALTERTAEIGLISALGGTASQTLWLFLGEAIFLSVCGGLLGLMFVVALVLLSRWLLPGLPLALNPMYLSLALLLSMLVGLLAGIVPAIRASRLNPIEALRDE